MTSPQIPHMKRYFKWRCLKSNKLDMIYIFNQGLSDVMGNLSICIVRARHSFQKKNRFYSRLCVYVVVMDKYDDGS